MPITPILNDDTARAAGLAPATATTNHLWNLLNHTTGHDNNHAPWRPPHSYAQFDPSDPADVWALLEHIETTGLWTGFDYSLTATDTDSTPDAYQVGVLTGDRDMTVQVQITDEQVSALDTLGPVAALHVAALFYDAYRRAAAAAARLVA